MNNRKLAHELVKIAKELVGAKVRPVKTKVKVRRWRTIKVVEEADVPIEVVPRPRFYETIKEEDQKDEMEFLREHISPSFFSISHDGKLHPSRWDNIDLYEVKSKKAKFKIIDEEEIGDSEYRIEKE